MEDTNPISPVPQQGEPQQPAPQPSSKKWYQHKGLITIIVMAILVVALSWVYFVKQPAKILNTIIPHQKAQIIQPTTTAQTGLPTTTSSTINTLLPSQDEQLVYADDSGKVYLYDVVNGSKTLLPINYTVKALLVSSDGKYLFFFNDNTPESCYIYNFANESVQTTGNIGPNANPQDFSPDGRYMVVDTGTGPGDRGKTLYDLTQNKVDWNSTGSYILWSPDSKSFALEQAAFDLIGGLGADVTTNSIYLETVNNGQVTEQPLFSGDNQSSYEPVKWVDTHTLEYEKDTFSKPFPPEDAANGISDESYYTAWQTIFDNSLKQYFLYDFDSQQSTATVTPVTANQSKNNNEIIYVSPLGDYEITIDLTNYADPSNIKSYLSKIDSSDKTLIIDNDNVAWVP